MGEYHKSKGKDNEDAYKILVNGDYVYCIVSDGAGSSTFAKEAAWCTVNTVGDFCYNSGQNFFIDEKDNAKHLIFDVQQALFERAKELKTDLSQMMCTLVLLAVNTKTKQYVTIHIGDGLIAKMTKDKTEIISYPENGLTQHFTYMVNSSSVMKHLRIHFGNFDKSSVFLVCSDGVLDGCFFTTEYIKRLKTLRFNHCFNDDATYCKIYQDKL